MAQIRPRFDRAGSVVGHEVRVGLVEEEGVGQGDALRRHVPPLHALRRLIAREDGLGSDQDYPVESVSTVQPLLEFLEFLDQISNVQQMDPFFQVEDDLGK